MRFLAFRAAAVLLACGALSVRAQDEPKKEKLPVPSSSQTRQVEKEIRDLFSDRYRATGREDLRQFAGELLEQAEEPELNATFRYVLLEQALDIAAKALDVKKGLDAVGQLVESYEVDPEKTCSSFVSAARKQIRKPAEAEQAAALYYEAAEKVVRLGHHDAALLLSKEVEKLARTARNSNLAADAKLLSKQIPELEREADQAGEVDLEAAIDLGATRQNLVVGRYLCFARDEWEKGLEFLLYAGNSQLEKIARQELDKPTGGEMRFALAEDWLAAGQRERNSLQKRRYEMRAFYWFEQARSVAKSLTRVRIDKRLNELIKKGLSSWRTRFGKGIVAAWDLNEGAGTKATDRSGRGFHGKMVGFSNAWQTGDPFARTTLEFNGSGAHIEVSPDALGGLSDAMTFSVWINKYPSPREFMAICSRQVGETQMEDLLFGFAPDGFVFVLRVEGDPEVKGVVVRKPFPTGEWHHVAATYDQDSGLTLYFNGEQIQQNPVARGRLAPSKRPLIIGANNDGPGAGANAGHFLGKMARFRIYDRALSASEIEQLVKIDR